MSKGNLHDLQLSLGDEFRKLNAGYALAFKYLRLPGIEMYINEHSSFHSASTMKTAVMIEVFKQSADGVINITDKIPVKNSFKSIYDGSIFSLHPDSDSNEALYNKIGQEAFVIDLVYDMITVSSNLATNILIDLVEPTNVQKTIHSLGAVNVKIIRGVEDIKAFDAGLYNTTTAKDLLIIFEKLANKEVISEKASSDMLKILLDQRFNDLIPAGLPAGTMVAHKTGLISGVRHDSGIVYLPDGDKYVLVILLNKLKDIDKAIKTVKTISKKIYNFAISIRK